MDSDNVVNQANKNRRKRKKSFLKNARKYGKKGCYGRGSQLDADTYQYFVRILEAFKEGFPSDEDKRTCFSRNVTFSHFLFETLILTIAHHTCF